MIDSLTASKKWCRYDDEFRENHGYRLPADPYCTYISELFLLTPPLPSNANSEICLGLAPPQGSIVPLWHRGGAPNYQPKPMICKHVQDPIKAWEREKQKNHTGVEKFLPITAVKEPKAVAADQGSGTGTITGQTETLLRPSWSQKHLQEQEKDTESAHTIQQPESFPQRNSLQLFQGTQNEVPLSSNGHRISIFFCSAGTIALRLADRLHLCLSSLITNSSDLHLCSRPKPLNSLCASDLMAENILLLIVSSTGEGDVPLNGLQFTKFCVDISSRSCMDRTYGFKFAVFGNGDSRYSKTYNAAAFKISDYLTQVGGFSLTAGVFQADTAVEPLPFSALKSWLKKLQPSIIHQAVESLAIAVGKLPSGDKPEAVLVSVTPIVHFSLKYEDYHDRLLSTLGEATLVEASRGTHGEGSLLATFDLDNDHFEEMSCLQILPSNTPSKVERALQSLCVNFSNRLDLGLDERNPTYVSFLTDYVDLELPLSDAECLEAMDIRAFSNKLSVLNLLELLQSSIIQMGDAQRNGFIQDLCRVMPLFHTRTYSLASSQHYPSRRDRVHESTGREVDIMVKVLIGGRFSQTFLQDATIPASLRYRIVDSPSGATLRKHHLKPFIAVATGAGFGPVRALLHWRMGIVRDNLAAGRPLPSRGSGVSLFLGLKPSDVELTVEVLNEAMALNLIDMLDIVVSNPLKRRVYDDLRRSPQHVRSKLVKKGGVAFVCTNQAAAVHTKGVFEHIFGEPVGEMLGERYVEEVF